MKFFVLIIDDYEIRIVKAKDIDDALGKQQLTQFNVKQYMQCEFLEEALKIVEKQQAFRNRGDHLFRSSLHIE